jgi:hypothetical protein
LAGVLKAYVTVTEQTLRLPAHLLRRARMPAIVGTLATLFATAFSLLLRRTREPALPRMSEQWLRSHDLDAGRHDDWSGY